MTALTSGRLALAVASLALVVALGGTSYAVMALAPNSVGTAQLKSGAVTSAKVKNGSLKKVDFAKNQLPQGPRGPQGPKGADGPAGAFTGTLPSGQTLRGVFVLSGPSGTAIESSVSWGLALASSPVIHVVEAGAPSTTNCPGTADAPAAAPGHACFYILFASNSGGLTTFAASSSGINDNYRFGTGIYAFTGTPANPAEMGGAWAVTAP